MTQSKTHDLAAAPWQRLSLNTASSGTGTRGPRPGDPDDPTNDLASETSMKRGSGSQLVSSARSWRWPEEPATGRSDHREHRSACRSGHTETQGHTEPKTSRCHCGSARRCLLLLQPLALRVRVAVISHQRGQVRAGDTRRTNGALSSLAGWLCQLEPGDRACGVAVVAPSRREDLDQAQAVAIFAGVQRAAAPRSRAPRQC